MSQSDKAAYYRALKAAGVKFDKHYREYSTDELALAYRRLQQARPELPANPAQPAPIAAEPQLPPPLHFPADPPTPGAAPAAAAQPFPLPRQAAADPNELPGQRLNQQDEDEPIRVDDQGRIWYQEEVLKPGYPKPRGRRVLTYMDTGSKTVTAKSGDYVESFEVAGDNPARPAEVKITMPSYQVGIYKDPRFPFKIHTYNGNNGFDLFEVQAYYGGAELVPAEVKRIYVENSLCYDIRTTVRAIETEYRQLQLQGKA